MCLQLCLACLVLCVSALCVQRVSVVYEQQCREVQDPQLPADTATQLVGHMLALQAEGLTAAQVSLGEEAASTTSTLGRPLLVCATHRTSLVDMLLDSKAGSSRHVAAYIVFTMQKG